MKILRYFSKGILSFLPVFLTIIIVKYIFDIFNKIIKSFITHINTENYYYTISLIIVIILLITYVGYLIDKKQESLILKLMDNLFEKIPFVKDIFQIFKHFTELFSKSKDSKYLGIVEVRFAGYPTYAFITKELDDKYVAFVPTAPNPTSGYVIYLYKNEENKTWKRVNKDINEALTEIISLGIK